MARQRHVQLLRARQALADVLLRAGQGPPEQECRALRTAAYLLLSLGPAGQAEGLGLPDVERLAPVQVADLDGFLSQTHDPRDPR